MANFEKITIIAIGVLVVAVLALGAIVFRQQKTIKDFVENTEGISNQPKAQSSAKRDVSLPSELAVSFSGTIENISGSEITVNVKLLDLSKPKHLESLKEPKKSTKVTEADFEVMEKKITVNTNEKTVFEGRSLAELKAGDTIFIVSDKAPYSPDTITAEKITFFELPK